MQDKIFKIFKSEVKKLFKNRIKKIILFGSRARGDNTPDSDYDFILILDEVSREGKKMLNDLEGKILYDYNAVLSAFPYTSEDLERKKFEPFIMNVQKEGKEI